MNKPNYLKATLAAAISTGDIVKIGDIKTRSTGEAARVDLDQVRNKLTMSATISHGDARRLREAAVPLMKAEEMADRLRIMQEMWAAKIRYMDRRTRRAYTRQFWANVEQFKAYCTKNGINYNIKKITKKAILFRGKHIGTGEWVIGSLVHLTGESAVISKIETDDEGNLVPRFAAVDPETVTQFIGLYDANFTPIFEGDILKGINDHAKVWTHIVYYDTECAQYCGYRCHDDLSNIGDPEGLTYFDITEYDKDRKAWYLLDTVVAGNLWDVKEPHPFESSCLIVDTFAEFRKHFNE